MKKKIILLILVLLFSLYGCESESKEPPVDYCEGKKCYQCGRPAETWCMGGVAEAYTPADRYENVGGIYRIFYCQSCWDKMGKVETITPY